ncbi:MAG: carboxypeptidase regulatory-like domain-containing protein [Acidobacteria bacterium]|nr:carboxypeptidase regulatory-like domain-containing protein [Acidobacteriota bacterium]
MTRAAVVAAFALLWLSCPGAASEQGQISGVVQDAAGSPVAGARIVIRNLETGHESRHATGPDGRYLARPLPAGTYRVTVTRTGFRAVRLFVEVEDGRPATAPVKLLWDGTRRART